MLLATLILSAAITPQAPPEEALPPEATAPLPPETPAPAMGIEASELPPPPSSGTFREDIEAGLKAFIRGRFCRARDAFSRAYETNPESAAAAFYLGYASYKIGEPGARMNADKEKARDLFAKAYTLDPGFRPVWGQKAAVPE